MSRDTLSRFATAYRTKAANALRAKSDWKQSPDQSIKGHTHAFESYLSLKGGRDSLYFNEITTDIALDLAIAELGSARELLGVGSKIIEQTYYDFHSQLGDGVSRNLIVAKQFGTFYTPLEVAEQMAEYLLSNRLNDQLIDPCSGSGMLAGAVLIQQARGNMGYARIKLIETDPRTLNWSKRLLEAIKLRHLLRAPSVVLEFTCEDASETLAEMARAKQGDADIIMNPPYGRLRFTSDTTTNQETKSTLSTAESSVKHIQKKRHTLTRKLFAEFGASSGVPEYSKLFLFLAAQCSAAGATAVAITPNSWMSGADGRALRISILERRLLRAVHLYPEDSKLFSTVNQATAVAVLDASEKERIYVAIHGEPTQQEIDYTRLLANKNLNLQVGTSVAGSEIFDRLAAHPRIRQIENLTNARGEIDQSVFRSAIKVSDTELPLVRGEHIQRFAFTHFSNPKKPGYLEQDARIRVGPKLAFTKSWRIVGRQCSYARQARRLLFAVVPPGVFVGNSCNFLALHDDNPTELWAWVSLLNSAVLDWFFRIGNANNHVANYEIDSLPVPHWNDENKKTVAALARAISAAIEKKDAQRVVWLEELLEAHFCAFFNLSTQDIAVVLGADKRLALERIQHLARKITAGAKLPAVDDRGFFNHSTPTLSNIDLRMIRCVPEGGNWQNISLDIPSARLDQIREMSRQRGVVRTTYYGRLKRDQPSYTISTYFNRPGNGTHIHPSQDRTLTCREAARLQTFPDSYVFFGGEGAVRNQIGNAVPPLLGKAVGEALLSLTDSRECVDVFCGAGGLSLGLEAAGWRTLCAIDNNAAALQTFGFNRPSHFESEETLASGLPLILQRDLHDSPNLISATKIILDRLAGRPLGLLAGGPPCQGFSHAGFRAASDKRNDLAVAYLRMAEVLQPEVFLLENVEGLLTFAGGKTLEEISSALRDLGYEVSIPVWRLAAEEFGVPQMRRRVFVVATKTGRPIIAPRPIHAKCPGRWKTQSPVTSLPAPLTVAEAFENLSMPNANGSLSAWFNSRSI